MASIKHTLLQTGGLFAAHSNANSTVVNTDVIVIGGGASGSHAAVRLTDYGQDVILIERQPHIVGFPLVATRHRLPKVCSSFAHKILQLQGGAVNTYTDPVSGKPYEFGVSFFIEYGNATGFFDRFNIPVSTDVTSPTMHDIYADFKTGQILSNYTGPSAADQLAALETYLAIAEKYEDMLIPGYWNFPNASDIPEDLLVNFSDFVEKYNFTDALPEMFSSTGLGTGNIMNKLTMPVMQAFGVQMSRILTGTLSYLTPSSGRNQDLYDAVARFLGDKVYCNTEAISSTRTDDGVTVTVRNSVSGQETNINAKKLLIAIEPVATRLAAFDLDEHEEDVFSKFKFCREYTAIVTNPSLQTNQSLYYLPYAANDNNFKTFPDFNFTSCFECVDYDSNLFRVDMIGDERLGPEEARAMAQSNFETLVKAGTLPASNQTELKFVAFSSHGPMHDRISAEDLKEGFIQDLLGLQGLRSTWYTGAAFASNYQTVLWQYNEILLPQMLAA
ncbi:Beta-cyclopiazonate dehydrogenase [Cytospora mali]|uniref:Beta-cyclopiazonate dehydrogenase n=1 Tax=Cytospora mali TaxID=578113 RepID=A0A194VFP1_CYTMA|nr:Beta-cyclopiazonate dehydrogenase [Valsa mali var. pyri (nom. inval.)]